MDTKKTVAGVWTAVVQDRWKKMLLWEEKASSFVTALHRAPCFVRSLPRSVAQGFGKKRCQRKWTPWLQIVDMED